MKCFFVISFLVLLAVSAGVSHFKPKADSTGKIVISYVCPDFWAKNEQIALFNKLHPQYEVRIDTGNAAMEKIIIQSLAGVGPDMFNSYFAWMSTAFISAGIAWDITDELAKAGISVQEQTWPCEHNYVIRDGRAYGFPYGAHTDILYYNKTLLDEQGIPYPTGVLGREDFLELARKLTVRDEDGRIKHYGFIFRWDHALRQLIKQWGGRIYSPDGTRCEVDCRENTEALQFIQDLIWKYKVSPSPEQESSMAMAGGFGAGTINLFGSGRAAMSIGGRWWMVQFRQKDQYPGLRVGVSEYQLGPHRVYHGYAGVIMINKNSPRREQALDYLKFLAGKEYNELVNRQADGFAPIKKYAYTEEFLHDPAHPDEDSNQVWRNALEQSIPDEISPFVNGSVEARILENQLDLIRANAKSVEAALRSAAEQINAQIARTIDRDPALRAKYRQLTAKGAP